MGVQVLKIIKTSGISTNFSNSISGCIFFGIQYNSPPYIRIRRVYHKQGVN
nr:MAG TPA: hypothetical protein [Bacteriophage sp.]